MMKRLAAKGVTTDDLKSWSEVQTILLTKIAKIQGL